MNINGADSGLLRIYKLNDNPRNAALQITAFEAGADRPSLPNTSDVLSQIAENPELAEYRLGKAFHGETNIVIAASKEMADKMDAILNRLDEDSQKHLIDSGLMTDEKFLAMASELDDKELMQLSKALQGVDTPSSLAFNYPAGETQRKLVDVLSGADDTTRSRILEQVAEYADTVVPDENDHTYTMRGHVDRNTTSNDLHNFVNALADTKNAGQFLDKLAGYDRQQQSQLLSVLSLDYDLGERLLDSLSGKDKEAKDNILQFVSEIANTASPMESKAFEGPDMPGTLFKGALPGSDNHFEDISKDTIETMVSLLEDYDFSDEQLLHMGTELNSLDRTNQRAYLAITQGGLAELLGDQPQNASADKLAQALNQVSALRSNEQTRMDVFLARYGEPGEHDSRYLEHKDKFEADRDMRAAVVSLFN